ncbi:hypothetical protein JNB_16524 [Janibacter sp. HTCC2649]|nr:hypothetical protein JNB_16524 [Janibacter sp. HTCC2649]
MVTVTGSAKGDRADQSVAKLKDEINAALARDGVDRDAPVAGAAPAGGGLTPQQTRPTSEEAKAMLEAVRKRADGWRNGIGATFTLILASLAIKPGEGFMKYTGDTRSLLMFLLAASLASALVGLFLLVNAANGPTWLTELLGDQANAHRYLRRVVGARRDLRRGQCAWGLSLLLFCLAVAVTWWVGAP